LYYTAPFYLAFRTSPSVNSNYVVVQRVRWYIHSPISTWNSFTLFKKLIS
jgi:hypothetical protein